MNALAKLWTLPREDRFLFCKAMFVVVAVRLSLSVVPFAVLRRKLKRHTQVCQTREIEPVLIRKMTWAVRTASRRVPYASCLTQALSLQILLSKAGGPADLKIGMTKGATGALEAHAWLELDGKIIIGRLPDLARFQSMLPLKGGQL